jgi:hypothetical protein
MTTTRNVLIKRRRRRRRHRAKQSARRRRLARVRRCAIRPLRARLVERSGAGGFVAKTELLAVDLGPYVSVG